MVGAGALGSPGRGTYLAAAGVGRIGMVDDDEVELSNLHRQPLHFTPDIGAGKADNAVAEARRAQPRGRWSSPTRRASSEQNAEAIVMGADVVVDCSDSFATRYAGERRLLRAGRRRWWRPACSASTGS